MIEEMFDVKATSLLDESDEADEDILKTYQALMSMCTSVTFLRSYPSGFIPLLSVDLRLRRSDLYH